MKPSFLRLIALVAASAVLFGACSSSGATASPTASPTVVVTAPPATPTPAPTPTAAPSSSSTPVPSAAPTAQGLAGLWNGTWKDTSPDTSGGKFAVTFTQLAGGLSGTIVVNGTPCLTTGTVTGTISGSTISFGAVSGQVKITYDGTISGNNMQGTYAAPACGDAKGDWTATKG